MSDKDIIYDILREVLYFIAYKIYNLFEFIFILLIMYLIASGIFCFIFQINWGTFMKNTLTPLFTLLLVFIDVLYKAFNVPYLLFAIAMDAFRQFLGAFYFVLTFLNYITLYVYAQEDNLI